ncbi:MAG: hypothetical protein KA314_18145 [Chloroflexi bacterium]|nr:hypothetical protein [Chloroflexota bacterium]MBP8057755.1 hypothetical protein [Chloroflexota bacterium]
MTPATTIHPLPDFETIFRQIVGDGLYGLNANTNEEWFSSSLDQTEDKFLFELLRINESRLHQRRDASQWESLKRKLSQTF